jgi:hypothetical protein
MVRTLLESIQEAATTLLFNIETFCTEGEDIDDILSREELKAIDIALWKMVDMTQ